MAQQLSTSASDAILACSVLYFILINLHNTFACLGLAVQGIAASLGVVRFYQARQTGAVYDSHRLASWLAQVVGLPLFAAGFCYRDLPVLANVNFMLMGTVLLLANFIAPRICQLATGACSGFALFSICMICYSTGNLYGLYATGAYILSGVIGADGKIGSVYRVDLLHIALTVGNVLYAWALKQL